MKIAMIGQRGLPATYGGIERHVEELGARMAEAGHEVVVYVRPGYSSGTTPYRGMRLVSLPTVEHKQLEAAIHSGLAAGATIGRGFDIVHFHALGPGLFSPVPRALTRAGVVQTIHGLDDQRGKWGGGSQRALRLGRSLSARVPDGVIVVSQELQRVYREEHGRETTYIPNGHPTVHPVAPGAVLARLGVTAGQYAVFLGRIVPEKDPLGLVRAFAQVETSTRLVIVGGSSNTDDYLAQLEEAAASDPRVVLAGYLYEDELAEVMTSAGIFVQPSLLEGLPITLLEAATFGLPIIASDIPAHREILAYPGPGARLVPAGHPDLLAAALREELSDPRACRSGAAATQRDVLARYDWDAAASATLALYEGVRRRRRVRPARG